MLLCKTKLNPFIIPHMETFVRRGRMKTQKWNFDHVGIRIRPQAGKSGPVPQTSARGNRSIGALCTPELCLAIIGLFRRTPAEAQPNHCFVSPCRSEFRYTHTCFRDTILHPNPDLNPRSYPCPYPILVLCSVYGATIFQLLVYMIRSLYKNLCVKL